MLDVLILPAFVVPQTFDQVIQGLLEPVRRCAVSRAATRDSSRWGTNILFAPRPRRVMKLGGKVWRSQSGIL